MQDDQWPAPPKRGNGEREQRPKGGNSGALPGQGPGATRPPNTTGQYNPGRPGGNSNTSGFGQSSYTTPGAARPQGPWRDDTNWGQADRSPGPQQRRGPSGPINSAGRGSPSSPLQPGGDFKRRSGGLSGPDQNGRGNGSWEAEGERLSGTGNGRASRNLSSPVGRPGQTNQTGRGQTGQWGANARGWGEEDLEDDNWGARNRQQRPPSGQMPAGGRSGQGAMSKPPRNQNQTRPGATRRGDWMIEETKSRAPNQTMRTRLLLAMLAAVIVLGAAVVFVPGARHRLLSFLPNGSNNSGGPSSATGATLTVQVNVSTATVTLDSQAPQKTTTGQTAPFSFATFAGVTAGQHKLTIHADTFTDATGSITMGASDTSVTVWLAPTQDALNALLQQLSTPTPQPDPGVAGDQYASGKRAPGKLTISIKYTLSGLMPNSFAYQIVPGADTATSPFKPVTLSLAPTVTFTSTGATIPPWSPAALPTSQLGVQVTLGTDSNGMLQLSPTVLLNSNINAQFPSLAGKDLLLDYALASAFPSPAKALNFTCVGATNPKNPEDGLFLMEAGGAHFFYRWGLLWATNGLAFTLAPKAPHALSGSNEFIAATNIETGANPTCASA